MPFPHVHFLSSGLAGVVGYSLTLTTLSALSRAVCPSRSRTSTRRLVGLLIGLCSLSAALFCALALHVALDYWPRVSAYLWWIWHGGRILSVAAEFRLWVEFFKIMAAIGLYDPATQTGLATDILRLYYQVTGGVTP